MSGNVTKLDYFDYIPEGFLTVYSREIRTVLPNPSIICVKGKREPALHVSILLHGNEITGLLAIQRLLSKYDKAQRVLPRSLIIFVGNVEATEKNLRHLPEKPDFNRIWGGESRLPEEKMAREVIDYVRQKRIFASIDIHNNTGKNPLYACVNHLGNHFINLASMFSRILVYFTDPSEVHSNAFAAFGPSVTLECGQSGEERGVQHVLDYIDDCLRLDHIMDRHLPTQDFQLFQTVSKIQIPENATICFDNEDETADFVFIKNLDSLNFIEQTSGTLMGLRLNPEMKLKVVDFQGDDVADDYILYQGDKILFRKTVTPSMFTQKKRVIFQDCLGYLMEPYSW